MGSRAVQARVLEMDSRRSAWKMKKMITWGGQVKDERRNSLLRVSISDFGLGN